MAQRDRRVGLKKSDQQLIRQTRLPTERGLKGAANEPFSWAVGQAFLQAFVRPAALG